MARHGQGRPAAAGALMLLAFCAAPLGSRAFGIPGAKFFSLVPSAQLREGQGQFQSLDDGASAEGFLDRLLGTACYSRAVDKLHADCRTLGQDTKSRLALQLVNCQLATHGTEAFTCGASESLKACTERLPDRVWTLYVEFLSHIDSMCLFLTNRNFEKYTEGMLNRLAEGADYAQEALRAISEQATELRGQAATIQQITQGTVAALQEHRALQAEAAELGRQLRNESVSQHRLLGAQQREALDLQGEAIRRQGQMQEGQQDLARRMQQEHALLLGDLGSMREHALRLARAQEEQELRQRHLGEDLRALSSDSRGIKAAVDVVVGYQQRSDALLVRVLGSSYSMVDVGFYGGGALAALAAGLARGTAGARAPILVLWGGTLLMERLALERLHDLLDVDERGEVVVRAPWIPGWAAALWPTVPLLTLNIKAVLRRTCVAVSAAWALAALLRQRGDGERHSDRTLRRWERERERRDEELRQMVLQHNVQVMARLDGLLASQVPARTAHTHMRPDQHLPTPPQAARACLARAQPAAAAGEVCQLGSALGPVPAHPQLTQGQAARDEAALDVAGGAGCPEGGRQLSGRRPRAGSWQAEAGVPAPFPISRPAAKAGAAAGPQQRPPAGRRRLSQRGEPAQPSKRARRS